MDRFSLQGLIPHTYLEALFRGLMQGFLRLSAHLPLGFHSLANFLALAI